MNNRNKALIFTGVILLVVALISFLVGGYLSGWDLIGFWTTPMAIWLYVLLGLYVFGVGALLLWEKISNL